MLRWSKISWQRALISCWLYHSRVTLSKDVTANMSGDRFLLSLNDVICSEKILRIKSLMKEGIGISQNLQPVDVTADIEEFMLSLNQIKLIPITPWDLLIIREKSKLITKDCFDYLSIRSEKHSNICMNCHGEAWRFLHKIYVNASPNHF